MDSITPLAGESQPQTQQIFVRADEVDSGTTIISAGGQKPLSALSPADGINPGTARPKPPPRPGLRREGSATVPPPPPPPSTPPPAPPTNVTDSLSLPQLKQLVNQFPKTEQLAYAYQYQDAEDYPSEIDEWFQYTDLEQDREYLLAAREAFEQRWKIFCQSELNQDDASWTEIDPEHRQKFAAMVAAGLKSQAVGLRYEALAAIYYVLTGVWSVNAGLDYVDSDETAESPEDQSERYNVIQIQWMHEGADLIARDDTIASIFQCLTRILDKPSDHSKGASEPHLEEHPDTVRDREVRISLSCLYLVTESARKRIISYEGQHIRHVLLGLQPNLLVYLVQAISRLRWDELYQIPSAQALHLLWKVVLLFFGDTKTHLAAVKDILQPRVDPFSSEAAHPILTASPLDYHMFRQEITSKYPAYNPPLPLIPLEFEQKSMLPPPLQAWKHESMDSFHSQYSIGQNGGSILHQPVHIATPAPSPPPSPAAGGKAGKKQNYQTNQNFPFLYPPLDSGSNNIGGKGSTEFQDMMVGKKWEGSDIPASIIEAGELFASRMRMPRAMRQLWKERDLFMKYERGWDGESYVGHKKSKQLPSGKDFGENEGDRVQDPDLQSRLDAVDDFFRQSLPELQSLIIVMMKIMLSNVQDIAMRNGSTQDSQSNGPNRSKSNPNMTQNQTLPLPPSPPRPSEIPLDELDNIRSREVSQKAISAVIFLLLKWFKVSHVLKFEYMTQLLLDSNYIQLTLKYFAHQNLEDLVAFSYDRNDLSFWHYCHIHSDHPPLSPTSPDSLPHSDSSSTDEAIPPPIQRHRRSPTSNTEGNPITTVGISHSSQDHPVSLMQSPEQTDSNQQTSHPSVDELGNPLGPLPNHLITTFSPRQFQISINLLRILQKVTRSKSHRILLLVQFKSSQILRRVLRVPDPMLRLYALKLFKSQVPYCGRKWRQSNMRVITAIYLHCRPELRDEWLAGMHDTNVEGEVDEAVPLEWALRGLTFWWMKRMFPDVMREKQLKNDRRTHDEKMGAAGNPDGNLVNESDDFSRAEEGGQEVEDDERDFFQRELDAMGWGMAALGLSEDVGFGEEAPGVNFVANGVNGEHHITWDSNIPGAQQQHPPQPGSAGGGMEMW